MARQLEPALTRRERQVMDVIYAKGEATVLDVQGALPDAPGKTSVRAMLLVLEEKGHLQHRLVGKTYLFTPRRSRESAGESAVRRVLDVFFSGSLEKLVAMHLGNSTDVSDDELRRLSDLIRKARKTGR